MTQPTGRDELARDLYVHVHDGDNRLTAGQQATHRLVRATEWDNGMVTDQDRAFFLTEADQQIAEEANP